jgi:hypothetical protein
MEDGRWTSCIRQNTRRGYYNAREGKWTSHVATAVDERGEGGSYQSCFFFSSVWNRLGQTIPVFPEFAIMVTGHGNRFGLIDNPMCPCKEEEEREDEEEQTTDQLVYR